MSRATRPYCYVGLLAIFCASLAGCSSGDTASSRTQEARRAGSPPGLAKNPAFRERLCRKLQRPPAVLNCDEFQQDPPGDGALDATVSVPDGDPAATGTPAMMDSAALQAAGLTASPADCNTEGGVHSCLLEVENAQVLIVSAAEIARPAAEVNCERSAGATADLFLGYRYSGWAAEDGVYVATNSACTLTRVVRNGSYDSAQSRLIATALAERAVRL